MKKRLLVLTLALTLLLSLTALAAPAPRFTDLGAVPTADIETVADLGLMGGIGGGKFAPGIPMTRAMLATALFRMAEVKGADYAETGLTDAPIASWYGPAAQWAWQAGLLEAGDFAFAPEAALTLTEALTALCRYTGDFASDPAVWGRTLGEGLPESLTRTHAATLLARFAATAPKAPVTLPAVVDANPGYGEQAKVERVTATNIWHNADGTTTFNEITYGSVGGAVEVCDHYREGAVEDMTHYGVKQAYRRDFGDKRYSLLCREDYPSDLARARDHRTLAYGLAEIITSVSEASGILTVATRYMAEGAAPQRYLYNLDANTLRLRDLKEYTLQEDGTEKLTVEASVLYGEKAKAPCDIPAEVAELEKASPKRTLTVIKGDETFTWTTADGIWFSFFKLKGYEYYTDAAHTVVNDPDPAAAPTGDVTLYLAPLPASAS